MSPDLRLRLHATQAQPCFPAASNALALPGGNGIFTATPAERITHYTLLRKVVCQMGALPPLETPTRKGGTLPLHGAHTAFSCYPALRLYRLSKSPRGIDVVSLTLGNSFAIFMLTGFIKAIPNELLEAAVLDGCSVYRTFWTIIFPLLKSAVTTLFILDFLSVWNDFLLPMLTLTDNSLKTVTVAMYNFYGEFGSRWEMTFAGYTLAIIPIVIVYLLLQKNIVEGIMIGAVKG